MRAFETGVPQMRQQVRAFQTLRAALIQAYYRREGIDALGTWNSYEQRQWLPADQLRRENEVHFEQTLAFAARRCSFYRERGCSSDPASFGPLRKREIMDNAEALTVSACKDKGCFTMSTSGTTGRVLDVTVDQQERIHRLGAAWRGDGYPAVPGGKSFPPWTPTAMLWGNTAVLKGRSQMLMKQAATWLFQKHIFNCFHLDAEQARADYEAIAHLRPQRLIGYVGALCALAREGQARGWEPLEFEKVVPTAEQLDEHSAAQIAAFFRGPQRQRYGCREAGDIAAQCEYGNWHLNSDFLYPEVLLPDGSIAREGTGTLLLTKLHNRVMPLIRYDIEDVVSIGGPSCPCGRGLPVMRALDGRYIDQLVCADGSLVSGLAVSRTLRAIPHYEFQARQERTGECTLLLVPQSGFNAEHAAQIHRAWREFIGSGISLRLELVENIPAAPSGKRQQVYSAAMAHSYAAVRRSSRDAVTAA